MTLLHTLGLPERITSRIVIDETTGCWECRECAREKHRRYRARKREL